MCVSDAKRLRSLEAENSRLKKLLAESMMDVSTLREMLSKNLLAQRAEESRGLGVRAPMVLPCGVNQCWSLDFVSDALMDGRRFRILCVIDDFNRKSISLVVEGSLTSERVTRELGPNS